MSRQHMATLESQIKPIRSDEDLDLAKSRLQSWLLSDENDDQIEILSLLIEDYERKTAYVHPPTPIAAIKFRMEELGLTARYLEPFIGSRARVSEVLTGKRTLSIDMIRSLHEGLSIPYECLMSVRKNSSDHEAAGSAVEILQSLGFDISLADIPSFVQAVIPQSGLSALHKKTRTQRAASKTDPRSLKLWQAIVLKKSERLAKVSFAKDSFSKAVLRQLALLSSKSNGPRKAISYLAENGITVVTVPSLPGTFLDGAAMLNAQFNPVIGLTLRHDRTDGFWFTLLHECSHIALHYEELKSRAIFVDDLEIQSDDIFESQADALARDSLIPPEILNQVRWDESTTQDEIVAVASRARVHASIVAGRWQRDHQNYKRFSRMIERDTLKKQLR